MRLRANATILLAAVLVTVASLGNDRADAETISVDDFNDCNDDGWTHEFHNIGTDLSNIGPAPEGTWDASVTHLGSCAYRMAAAEAPLSVILATWDASSDPVFSNGFFRARVRPETQETAIIMGMRGDFDGAGLTGPANQGEIFLHNDTMRIREHAVGDQSIVQAELDIQANEDWFMQIGTVGDQFSLKAWPVGEPEPASPQLTATYTSTATGKLLLGTGVPPGGPGGVGSVVFDDIVFFVPEPSTSVLAAIGVLGILAVSRRRREPSANEPASAP